MNIKSLLLGSAAALAAVSGAQAADAIVAAAPEPMEYVRVCDAFGTGYFYIPGTETCLKVGGYVRFQVDFGEDTYTTAAGGTDDWDMATQAYLTFDAKSDTELGVLQGYIALESDISYDSDTSIYADEAFLALGGMKAGWFYSYWDSGIAGEVDNLGSATEFVSIGYEFASDAYAVGFFVDEFDKSDVTNNHGIGLEAQVSGSFGPVTVALLGGYDTDVEEGTIRAIATAAVGPGTFSLAGLYSTDPNAYGDEFEWAIATSYALKATEKLTITPGFQYSANAAAAGVWSSNDQWKAGVLFDYEAVENFHVKLNVNYTDPDAGDETFDGWFRLQRDF